MAKKSDRILGGNQLRLPGAAGRIRDVELITPHVAELPVTTTRRYEWDMAHRLPYHDGKCRRLHGHRYVAEIDVTGQLITGQVSSAGMVLDFGVLDKAINKAIGYWDHRTMLWSQDPLLDIMASDLAQRLDTLGVFTVPFIPTAENIAREVVRLLAKLPQGHHASRVRIYETPKGWAEARG